MSAATAQAAGPLLEVRGATVRYPGVLALDGVDLELHAGEVVGLVGENGAGKSTLLKVLGGAVHPDAGEVRVGGRPVRLRTPRDAAAHGVALIHQELLVCDNLDVAGNVFLGREPTRHGLLDRARMERDADAHLRRLGRTLDPRTPLEALSTGACQLVEIARALASEARLIVMDEPTSSLSAAEVEALFEVVRLLRARGACVVIVSHRLGEVASVCDRAVVLRDGRVVGALGPGEVTEGALLQLLTGEGAEPLSRREPPATGAVLLEAAGLETAAHPGARVDLEIRAGELVGLAGLVGAGRTELLRAIFGIDGLVAGEVRVGGEPLRPGEPRAAVRAGLGLVPEDRKLQGLFLEMAVRENAAIAARGLLGPRFWIDRRGEAARWDELAARLRVRAARPDEPVARLSGGNQQKVVLAKWLALRPRALLCDEPTRGVDVAARREIYALLRGLAADGCAVLMASSETEEVLDVPDRVLVLRDGALVGELSPDRRTEAELLRLATGAA